MESVSKSKPAGSVTYKPKNFSNAGTYNNTKHDSIQNFNGLQVVHEYPESAELEYVNPLDDGDRET